MEHLGLRCKSAGGESTELPVPRDGWGPVEEALRRLGLIPGGQEVREKLLVSFIVPKWRWAAPLAEAPPASFVRTVEQVVRRSASTWWCKGRWWADRVLVHPVLGTAVQALKTGGELVGELSGTLRAAVEKHASELNMEVACFEAGVGLFLKTPEDADFRAVEAATSARNGQVANGLFSVQQQPGPTTFLSDRGAGAHAVRVAARVTALSRAVATRLDVEGLERADVQVYSHPAWQQWKRRLTTEERTALNIFRGGATKTPTRRWSRAHPFAAVFCRCDYCGADWASARHQWAECPKWERQRRRLEQEHYLVPGWWTQQPRCTAKSGWTTVDAAGTPKLRLEALIATCRLGIAIIREGFQSNRQAGGGGGGGNHLNQWVPLPYGQ